MFAALHPFTPSFSRPTFSPNMTSFSGDVGRPTSSSRQHVDGIDFLLFWCCSRGKLNCSQTHSIFPDSGNANLEPTRVLIAVVFVFERDVSSKHVAM